MTHSRVAGNPTRPLYEAGSVKRFWLVAEERVNLLFGSTPADGAAYGVPFGYSTRLILTDGPFPQSVKTEGAQGSGRALVVSLRMNLPRLPDGYSLPNAPSKVLSGGD